MADRRDFTNGLVLGAAVGTALGLLFAPDDGSALLRRLQTEMRRLFAAFDASRQARNEVWRPRTSAPVVRLDAESASSRLRGGDPEGDAG